MGCNHNTTNNTSTPLTLNHFTISFLFLVFISTSTQVSFTAAAGRPLGNPHAHSSQEEKMFLRGQIGSRPPRCEMKCSSCGECEAIQVPTNPQLKGRSRTMPSNHAFMYTISYSRSADNSNYKPMSWKCKCGKFIFNP